MDCEFCGLGAAIEAESGIKAQVRVLPDGQVVVLNKLDKCIKARAWVLPDGLSIEFDDGDHSYDFGFAIKHCPMCGKKIGSGEVDTETVLLQRIYDFLSVSIGILGPRLNPDDERARELWKIYRDTGRYLGVKE